MNILNELNAFTNHAIKFIIEQFFFILINGLKLIILFSDLITICILYRLHIVTLMYLFFYISMINCIFCWFSDNHVVIFIVIRFWQELISFFWPMLFMEFLITLIIILFQYKCRYWILNKSFENLSSNRN